MGWFSNPRCPRCGRETSIDSDGLTEWYTCHPCNRKAREDENDKQDMKDRISKLEKLLKDKK